MLIGIRVAPIFSSALSVQVCWCQEVLAQAYFTWHGPGCLMNTHTRKTKRSEGEPAFGHFCHVCSCVTGWDHPNHMHLSPFSPLFIHTNLFTLEEGEKWYTPFTTQTNPEEWICFSISVSVTSCVRSLCSSIGRTWRSRPQGQVYDFWG